MVESLSLVVLADPDAAPEGVPPALAVDADRARRFDDPLDVVDVDAFDEDPRRFDCDDESLADDDDDDREDELLRFDRDDESPDAEPELDDDRDDELRRFDEPLDDDRDEPLEDDDRDEPLDDDRLPELPLLAVVEPPDALAVDPPREDPPSSVRHALGSGMPEVRLAT
ncbi:hypothetical protein [Halorubellus salinus]|uniref:hypothetical protein n=1 Tax=Halorubellus salinus TaxID=755309 RepID=UPI001D0767DD|nr:hypothetical protein [Halorubellus salinus]